MPSRSVGVRLCGILLYTSRFYLGSSRSSVFPGVKVARQQGKHRDSFSCESGVPSAPPRTVHAPLSAHGSPVLMGYLVIAQAVAIRSTIAFPFSSPSPPIPLPPSPLPLSLPLLTTCTVGIGRILTDCFTAFFDC